METPSIHGLPPSVPIRKGRIRDDDKRKERQFQETLGQHAETAEGDDSREPEGGTDSESPIARHLQEQARRIRKEPPEGEHHLDVMA